MKTCEVCGSGKANRKAKIEKAVLIVCDNCVKLGEELPIFIRSKKENKRKKIKKKNKGGMTIGDIVEVD